MTTGQRGSAHAKIREVDDQTCWMQGHGRPKLTSHLTPNPPISPLLQPGLKHTSPLAFLALSTSFSRPTSSLRASHLADPICASIVELGSSP